MCPSRGRTLQRKSTLDFVSLETVAEIYLGYVFMSDYFKLVTMLSSSLLLFSSLFFSPLLFSSVSFPYAFLSTSIYRSSLSFYFSYLLQSCFILFIFLPSPFLILSLIISFTLFYLVSSLLLCYARISSLLNRSSLSLFCPSHLSFRCLIVLPFLSVLFSSHLHQLICRLPSLNYEEL
jgi:hypothetical protein